MIIYYALKNVICSIILDLASGEQAPVALTAPAING